MRFIQTYYIESIWPMNIGESPFLKSNPISIRYGLYLIFILSAANMIVQSLLIFKSTKEVNAKPSLEQMNSNPEILDELDE